MMSYKSPPTFTWLEHTVGLSSLFGWGWWWWVNVYGFSQSVLWWSSKLFKQYKYSWDQVWRLDHHHYLDEDDDDEYFIKRWSLIIIWWCDDLQNYSSNANTPEIKFKAPHHPRTLDSMTLTYVNHLQVSRVRSRCPWRIPSPLYSWGCGKVLFPFTLSSPSHTLWSTYKSQTHLMIRIQTHQIIIRIQILLLSILEAVARCFFLLPFPPFHTPHDTDHKHTS